MLPPEIFIRFARSSYFLDGHWEQDLKLGKEPVLLDPQWEGTALEKQIRALPLPLAPFSQRPNSPGFWLATSGSTGSPKLIYKNWEMLEAEVQFWISPDSPMPFLRAGLPFFATVPLCFLYGLLWGFLIPRALGSSFFVEAGPPFPKEGILVTVPSILSRLWERSQPLPQRILSSGAPFPKSLAREIRKEGQTSVREIYGSTETGAMGWRDPLWKNRFWICPPVQARVSEEDSTLLIRSPWSSLFSHAEAIVDSQGMVDTRDEGDLTDNGWFCLGRKDRIIKKSGKRISLDQVEALVSEIPGVIEAGVVALWESDYLVFCFLQLQDGVSPATFLSQARSEIPGSMQPDVWRFEQALSKLPNGKLNYPELERISQEIKENTISHPKPNWELLLQEVVLLISSQKERTLGTSKKTPRNLDSQPFPKEALLLQDLGFTSLDIAHLILEVEKHLKKRIPEEEWRSGYFATLGGIQEYLETHAQDL